MSKFFFIINNTSFLNMDLFKQLVFALITWGVFLIRTTAIQLHQDLSIYSAPMQFYNNYLHFFMNDITYCALMTHYYQI